jgi:hypothetical protein
MKLDREIVSMDREDDDELLVEREGGERGVEREASVEREAVEREGWRERESVSGS